MFLRDRATQAEYCDRPDLPPDERCAVYRQLDRINRLLHTAATIQEPLIRILGDSRSTRITVLDLGAGDGALGREIELFARARGRDWRVTSIDSSVDSLTLGTGGRRVAGNVCALPFADDSFDVVLASQMTHHLTDREAVRHFAEAWRVSRDLVLILDTHRNILALGFITLLLAALGFSRTFRADAALSVRRGWRINEWRALAAQAGLRGAEIKVIRGARIWLTARKTG